MKGKLKLAKPKSVGPGQSLKLKAFCPPGSVPVGDGEKSGSTQGKGAQASSVGGVGGTQVTSVLSKGRSISIGIRNPTSQTEQVRVGANCLPKTLKAGDAHGSIQFQRGSFPESVAAGGTVVSAGCPGALPLSTGFSLPPGGQLGFLGTGFREGSLSASWAFSNSSGQTQQARVSLTCVPGRVKFVRGLSGATSIDTIVGPITITG